ncbi:unnamed protein product [Polarella glacialis]|uniref:Uncharacterized protein n=1 Tax=Polarella glacialis TaxID=89957 RepID=A0A813GPW3_POLGL|nr:unnamed protein product [Polarella glacialis]
MVHGMVTLPYRIVYGFVAVFTDPGYLEGGARSGEEGKCKLGSMFPGLTASKAMESHNGNRVRVVVSSRLFVFLELASYSYAEGSFPANRMFSTPTSTWAKEVVKGLDVLGVKDRKPATVGGRDHRVKREVAGISGPAKKVTKECVGLRVLKGFEVFRKMVVLSRNGRGNKVGIPLGNHLIVKDALVLRHSSPWGSVTLVASGLGASGGGGSGGPELVLKMKRSKLMGELLVASVGLTSVTFGLSIIMSLVFLLRSPAQLGNHLIVEGELVLDFLTLHSKLPSEFYQQVGFSIFLFVVVQGVKRDFLRGRYFACTICCKSFGFFGVTTHEVNVSIIIQAELFRGGGPELAAPPFCLKMKRSKLMDEPLFVSSWRKDGAKLFMMFLVFLLRSPVHVVVLIFNFCGRLVYQWHSTVPFGGNFRIDIKLARSVEHFGSECWRKAPVSREDGSTFFSIPLGNPYFRIAGAEFSANAKPDSKIEEVFFSDRLYPFFILRFIVEFEGYDIDYRGREGGRRSCKGIVHDAGDVLMPFLMQDNIIEYRRGIQYSLICEVFDKDGESNLPSFDVSSHSSSIFWVFFLLGEGAAVVYVIFIIGGVFNDNVASSGSKVFVVTTEVSKEEGTIPSTGVSISTVWYFELKMIGWVGIMWENFSSYFDPEVTKRVTATSIDGVAVASKLESISRSFNVILSFAHGGSFISRTSCIISLRVGWIVFVTAFMVMVGGPDVAGKFPNMELEFCMVYFGSKLRAMFRDMFSNRFDSSSGVTRFEDHAVEVTGVSSIQKDMGGVPSILIDFARLVPFRLLAMGAFMLGGIFVGAVVVLSAFSFSSERIEGFDGTIRERIFNDVMASPSSEMSNVVTEVCKERDTVPSAGVYIGTLRHFKH